MLYVDQLPLKFECLNTAYNLQLYMSGKVPAVSSKGLICSESCQLSLECGT
jgi:hypothetical protein